MNKSITKRLSLITDRRALAFTLCLYAATNCFLVMCKGYTPDELWFFKSAPTAKGAYLNYGHIYWVYLKLIHNIDLLRALSYVYILSIPFFFIAFGRHLGLSKKEQLITILIWLSCPIAWWRGKLIGPELIGLFISLIGLYFFYQTQCKQYQQKKILLAFIIMGIGTAIKLNNIVFPIYAGSLFLFDRIEQLSFKKVLKNKSFYIQLSQIIILFLLSFLVSIGAYTKDFSFPELSSGVSLLELQFSPLIWTWDFMLISSLSQASVALPALIVVLRFYKKDRYTSSFLIALVITLAAKAGISLSWYYLPITTLGIVSFLHSIKNQPSTFLWLLFFINAVCQAPVIGQQLYIRAERIYADYTASSARQEIKQIIQKNTQLNLNTVAYFGFNLHQNETQSNTLPLLGPKHRLKKWHTMNNDRTTKVAIITLSPIYQYLWDKNQILQLQQLYPLRLFRETDENYKVTHLGSSYRREIYMVQKN